MPNRKALLEAALVRGLNMANGGEHPRIQSYAPTSNEMERIILAAVLNLHEAVMSVLDRLAGAALPAQEKETPEDRSVLNITNKDGGSPAAAGPRLVDKLCASVGCGEMMYQVPISRKYCDKCKGAK